MAVHPKEMQVFCVWVDKYKERVHWKGLFSRYFKDQSKASQDHGYDGWPKFHDLPIAMQMGIFAEFAAESENRDFQLTVRATIRQWFVAADMESEPDFSDEEKLSEI